MLFSLCLLNDNQDKLFIRPPSSVRRFVAVLVLGIGSAPCLTWAQAEVSADLRVAEAEREFAEEIRRLYLKGQARYRIRDYVSAERLFGDCYALYQASREHFSGSADLATLSRECERHMQDLAILRRREAISGGWQARLIIKNTSDYPAEKQIVINGVTIVKVRIEPNADIIIHSKEEPEDGKFVLQAYMTKEINRAIGRYLSVTIHNNGIEEVGVANDPDGAARQNQNEMVQLSIYVAMLRSVELK